MTDYTFTGADSPNTQGLYSLDDPNNYTPVGLPSAQDTVNSLGPGPQTGTLAAYEVIDGIFESASITAYIVEDSSAEAGTTITATSVESVTSNGNVAAEGTIQATTRDGEGALFALASLSAAIASPAWRMGNASK